MSIRTQFRDTAVKVFQEVLGKPLPETITVNMAISDNKEFKGESAGRLASFNVGLSRDGILIFTIWALSYFFYDEDIIHDEISGLGLVDDLAVIDYAIRLIRQ